MRKEIIKTSKIFECISKCDFPKLEGITLSCDKCIKHTILYLTKEQKEKILVILKMK